MWEDDAVMSEGLIIKSIEEPDFGCEGLPEGKVMCDKVVLVSNEGETSLEIPEKTIWEMGWDEGSRINMQLKDFIKKFTKR